MGLLEDFLVGYLGVLGEQRCQLAQSAIVLWCRETQFTQNLDPRQWASIGVNLQLVSPRRHKLIKACVTQGVLTSSGKARGE